MAASQPPSGKIPCFNSELQFNRQGKDMHASFHSDCQQPYLI